MPISFLFLVPWRRALRDLREIDFRPASGGART